MTTLLNDPDDPFDLLGIPPTFPPDLGAIDRAWRAVSAQHHPDRADDPAAAARRLARYNQARRTLSSFELCANALLRRIGGPSSDQDKALPEGLLQDMLDARDRLDDAAGDADALADIEAWARAKRDAHITHVAELFAGARRGAASPALLHDIRVQLNAWRYVERFLDQLAGPDSNVPSA